MEKVYDALVAQLELAIHHYDRGLVIKVSGFNHKLHVRIIASYENTVIVALINSSFFLVADQCNCRTVC